jgi:hypothetical protein
MCNLYVQLAKSLEIYKNSQEILQMRQKIFVFQGIFQTLKSYISIILIKDQLGELNML